MHYPSQTAAPSRGFPDFQLRAPAASVAEPESGSTTEISESEDEEEADEGVPAGAQPIVPVQSADPLPNAIVQHTQPSEASTTSELLFAATLNPTKITQIRVYRHLILKILLLPASLFYVLRVHYVYV